MERPTEAHSAHDVLIEGNNIHGNESQGIGGGIREPAIG